MSSEANDSALEALYPLPQPPTEPSRGFTAQEASNLQLCQQLQFFLATAPAHWMGSAMQESSIISHRLPCAENVSCVLWNGLYHMTGTDIVRALAFRFEAFGRPVVSSKKWEEGVFSDLRNLKPGVDATLEEPKSPLLDYLFRNGCIRTQKKQKLIKVFFWFSIPHDRLFLDALERDLKREKMGLEPTSIVSGEPARSFRYDPKRSLFEQFAGANPGLAQYSATPSPIPNYLPTHLPAITPTASGSFSGQSYWGHTHPIPGTLDRASLQAAAGMPQSHCTAIGPSNGLRGSPAYKSRRRPTPATVLAPDAVHPDAEVSGHASNSSIRRATSVTKEVSDGDNGVSVSMSRASTSALDQDIDSRRFACPIRSCQRAFKRLEHLKRHIRTHTRERPYACRHCVRSFSRQDNLVQHVRTHGRSAAYDGVQCDFGGPVTSLWDQTGYTRYNTASPGPSQSCVLSQPPAERDASLLVSSGVSSLTASSSVPSLELYNQRSCTVPPGWQSWGYLDRQ